MKLFFIIMPELLTAGVGGPNPAHPQKYRDISINRTQKMKQGEKALLNETAEQTLVIVVREPAVLHQKRNSSMNLHTRTRLCANTAVSFSIKHLTEGSQQ